MIRNPHIELERARSALMAIDPGCDHDKWVKVMTAAKAAGLDFEAVNEWSAGAGNYKGEKDVLSAWRGLEKSGPVTAGTLFYLAKEAGWREGEGHTEPRQRQTRERPAQATAKPTVDPVAVWDRCVSANPGHGYIARKNGFPEGLRVYPAHAERLTIAGQDVAGWLVLPAVGLQTGDLKTLQFIPPGEGKKLNLPGCPVAGAFVVGSIEAGKPCYLVEGIGQAWAVSKATGAAAVVTFGAGRMEAVARELRNLHPHARPVLVADVGKREHCRKIAEAVGGGWVCAPDDLGNNGDINDMEKRDGWQAVAQLLAAVEFPPVRFRLMTAGDLLRLPPVQWIVKGVLPRDGLAVLYGPSGSGKSFLVLDLLACVVDGREWFGRKARPVPVTYCALEGEAGLAQRMQAYQMRHGAAAGSLLRFMTCPFDLLTGDDVEGLAKAIGSAGVGGGVVVLDTLNRAAPGTDENSSQDMGHIIAACKRLQGLVGGLVLLVHHTGKDATKGLRGHSSLPAALDVAIEVVRNGVNRGWRLYKAKDGQDNRDGDAEPFRLEQVTLGEDADGEPVTSCVVVRGEPEQGERVPKLTGTERLAFTALQKLEQSKGDAPPEDAPEWVHVAVKEDDWRTECYAAGISTGDDPSAKRKAFQRARQGLMDKRMVGCRDDLYWIA
jgi:putative DNA primase/helicase